MTATLSMKQSSLEMMLFSNVQFQASSQTLSLCLIGWIQRGEILVLQLLWVSRTCPMLKLLVFSSDNSLVLVQHPHCFVFSVTSQHFQVDIFREVVIVGNDAIFKCSVPSFVSDFVQVDSWVDSEGNNFDSQTMGKE